MVLDVGGLAHGCYIVHVLFEDGSVGTQLMLVE
jgi:hypothetical protein